VGFTPISQDEIDPAQSVGVSGFRPISEEEIAPAPTLSSETGGIANRFLTGLLGVGDLAEHALSPESYISAKLFGTETPGQIATGDLTSAGSLTKAQPQTAVGKILGGVAEFLPALTLPGAGVVATVGGGASKGIAEASGAGPVGQLLASLIGGVGAGEAVSGAAGFLSDAAPGLARKSIGARFGDYAKTADELQTVADVGSDAELQTRTATAIDSLISQGTLGNSRNAGKMLAASSEARQGLEDQVGDVISNYDAAGAEAPIPSFENTLNYITKNVPADEVEKYVTKLSAYRDSLDSQGDGTLRYLQNQKTSIGTKWDKNDTILNGYNRALYKDLQGTIESVAPDVAPLNKALQDYHIVTPILKRGVAQDESANLINQTFQFLRTSGGGGVPIVAGSHFGPLGTLVGTGISAGLHLAGTPRTQSILAKLLSSVAPLAETNVTGAISPLLASLLGQPNASRGQSPQITTSIQQQPTSRSPQKASASIGVSSPNDRANSGTTQAAIKAAIKSDPYYAALAQTESGFDPKAENKAPGTHAQGLFQFEPATAKAVGLKDPFDAGQSFEAVQKLTAENKAIFGSDPVKLYAAHYLGASTLIKVMKGMPLSEKEQEHVIAFRSALTSFIGNYKKEIGAA
jgi:hypothetical protein